MNDEELNNQLYQRLCDGVRRWFEKDRGYRTTYTVSQEELCRSYTLQQVVIGDAERDAKLEVGVLLWNFDMKPYCWLCCDLTFNDEIRVAEENIELEVLRLINRFNTEHPARCIYYDKETDKICVHQEWNIHQGAEITDEEIGQMIDSFMLNTDLENLCNVIEAGGWLHPDLYIEQHTAIIECQADK